MHIFDVNCFFGHWPFRKIYRNTLNDLMKTHSENDITGGFVASLNSIFYADPFEGDEELHAAIKQSGYRHILTVNPMHPAFEEDIWRGIEQFNISGVRIYPGYHDFSLDCEQIELLCTTLKKYQLPLLISLRMEDERLNYIIKPDPVDTKALQIFIENNPGVKTLLLNFRFGEIISLKGTLLASPFTFFDTSGLKDQLFNIEKLVDQLGDGKILYGSQYPLYCLKSTLLQVIRAEISKESKENILFRNADLFNSVNQAKI